MFLPFIFQETRFKNSLEVIWLDWIWGQKAGQHASGLAPPSPKVTSGSRSAEAAGASGRGPSTPSRIHQCSVYTCRLDSTERGASCEAKSRKACFMPAETSQSCARETSRVPKGKLTRRENEIPCADGFYSTSHMCLRSVFSFYLENNL